MSKQAPIIALDGVATLDKIVNDEREIKATCQGCGHSRDWPARPARQGGRRILINGTSWPMRVTAMLRRNAVSPKCTAGSGGTCPPRRIRIDG